MNENQENRILSTSEIEEDIEFDSDNPLRPQVLSEYIGQDKVKENLLVFIEAAKMRKEALDHILLYSLHHPPNLNTYSERRILVYDLKNAGFFGIRWE